MNITDLKNNSFFVYFLVRDWSPFVDIYFEKKGTDKYYRPYMVFDTEKQYVRSSDLTLFNILAPKSTISYMLIEFYNEVMG